MKIYYWLSAIFLLISPTLAAQSQHSDHQKYNNRHDKNSWQTIQLDPQIEIIDDQGNPKIINPACAFDTLPNPTGGEPLNNAFRFFFKQGISKNLLVYFNGGGACWNDATCVASLALQSVPDASAIYNPSVLDENSPIGAGGVFDDKNRENPFKNWSKVFIPYCTGDLHIGSSNMLYTDVDGSITGNVGGPFPVKHHGFDNFMAVRDWLKNNAPFEPEKVKKLLVTGSSAGGYGATLNFPYMQSAFPKSKVHLLADASESVVTDGFINSVFTFDKNWKVENTLAPLFKDGLGGFSALNFNNDVFVLLTDTYPRSHFAQYTSAQDSVQVQFLKIMDQVDQGNNNPFSWGLGLDSTDYLYFIEWNSRMEASSNYLSENTENYQYYIGEGMIHTILTDAFATEAIPHPFYSERSARNLRFTRWLNRFVWSRRFREQSVKYSD